MSELDYYENRSGSIKGGKSKHIVSPLPGVIIKIYKKVGEEMKGGEKVVEIMCMKTLVEIRSPEYGVVEEILVNESEFIQQGKPILKYSSRS